ncbi:MAG: MarR family winged helix-turn-helix transcriptional regulator [Lachnospira sp.]
MNTSEVLHMMDHKYALFGLFFAFHNRLQAVGDSFYDEITCKQFFLLACMNLYQDEAPTANELAKTMGCSRQNVKEILNSLEKKQLISLEIDSKDTRKKRVYLTERARLMADQYREKETDFMNYLFEGVTEKEVDDTYNIISKIEDNLKRMKGSLKE